MEDRKPVLIKTIKDEYPSMASLTRLKHEFEIGSGLDLDLAGLESTLIVGEIVDASLEVEPPDRLDRGNPGTEAKPCRALFKIVPPQETHFGIEVLFDHKSLDLHTVTVSAVLEPSLIARVVSLETGRRAACPVGVDVQVLEEGEIPIDTEDGV